jgi:predicted GIY-YIG superfamily endonuclease
VTAQGSSCVYLIELDEDPPRLYVGETDKLSQRFRQHRAKGAHWSSATAWVIPADNKSEARQWESRLIRTLAQAGIQLVSTADGRNS